jgi:hypothetical protein
MNMGKEEILDLVWRDREGLPVSVGIIPFLEQTAINEDLYTSSIQKVA